MNQSVLHTLLRHPGVRATLIALAAIVAIGAAADISARARRTILPPTAYTHAPECAPHLPDATTIKLASN